MAVLVQSTGKGFVKQDIVSGDVDLRPATLPKCSAYHSTTQTAGIATNQIMALDSEEFQEDANGAVTTMHSGTTNNSRITVPEAGFYLVTGRARVAGLTTTSVIRAMFYVNGSMKHVDRRVTSSLASAFDLTTARVFKLAVNDYVELAVAHNDTTAALTVGDTNSPAVETTNLQVVKLA